MGVGRRPKQNRLWRSPTPSPPPEGEGSARFDRTTNQNGLITEKKRPSQPWRAARATSPLPV
jgi:hypothetical protein